MLKYKGDCKNKQCLIERVEFDNNSFKLPKNLKKL